MLSIIIPITQSKEKTVFHKSLNLNLNKTGHDPRNFKTQNLILSSTFYFLSTSITVLHPLPGKVLDSPLGRQQTFLINKRGQKHATPDQLAFRSGLTCFLDPDLLAFQLRISSLLSSGSARFLAPDQLAFELRISSLLSSGSTSFLAPDQLAFQHRINSPFSTGPTRFLAQEQMTQVGSFLQKKTPAEVYIFPQEKNIFIRLKHRFFKVKK